MKAAYYNEIDAYAAQWLRNLMAAGLIMEGDVDERSIADVRGDDVKGYVRCHFFAGIGGWDLALSISGWPVEREVWTGSCPCQPFSVAGAQRGFDDPRHLWPRFYDLIKERRPPVVLGEQVANAPQWINLVRSDLEKVVYAVGIVPIEAASAGADHFRDRYWFVADRDVECSGEGRIQRGRELGGPGGDQEGNDRPMADGDGERSQVEIGKSSDAGPEREAAEGDRVRDVVHSASHGWGEGWTEHEFRSRGFSAAVAGIEDSQYIECPDGKWRRLPPSRVRWLGTGVPSRVAKLRAIGNAIDWRPASAFISAYLDCRP